MFNQHTIMAEIIRPFDCHKQDGCLVGDFFIHINDVPEEERSQDIYGTIFISGQEYNTVLGTKEGEYIRFHSFDIDPETCHNGLRYLRSGLAFKQIWSVVASTQNWTQKFEQFYVSSPANPDPIDSKVEYEDSQAIYRVNTKGYVDFIKSINGLAGLCTFPSTTDMIEERLPQLSQRQPVLQNRGDYLRLRLPRAFASEILCSGPGWRTEFVNKYFREKEDRYMFCEKCVINLHTGSVHAFCRSFDYPPSTDLVDVLYVYGDEPMQCIFEFSPE